MPRPPAAAQKRPKKRQQMVSCAVAGAFGVAVLMFVGAVGRHAEGGADSLARHAVTHCNASAAVPGATGAAK